MFRNDMFKGLKSKLEDEAKRIQAYSENLRSNASDAGSDISGRGRKFLGSALGIVQQSEKRTDLSVSPNKNDDTLISLDENPDLLDDSASMLQTDDDDGPPSTSTIPRQRHFSNASMDSNESSFSNLNLSAHIQPSSSAVLDTISSDVESNAGSVADISSIENVSDDKLNSIFLRLQGRAVDYKQKYRELVKSYREIERENEKCRVLLASTQDKALARISKLKEERRDLHERLKEAELHEEKLIGCNAKIQKLQELLSKCKDEITANRERITILADENKLLKERETVELSVEKVCAEWKGRFDRQEDEWTRRLAECEEKTAIAIATSKAEMHSAIQQKDQELERWIEKCHGLEKQDADANVRWQEKVESLQKAIMALEQEKADMVQKLSQAKQEGVKLVKESEEKRHGDILSAELKKKDEDWGRRVKELEEQMQLSVEASDLQRSTVLAEHNREVAKLREQTEELEKENSRILNQFYAQKEEFERIKDHLAKFESEIQQKETNAEDEQQMTAQITKNLEIKLMERAKEVNDLKERLNSLEQKTAKVVEEQKEQLEEKLKKIEELNSEIKEYKDEMAAIKSQMETLQIQLDEQKNRLSKKELENDELNARLKLTIEENSRIVELADNQKADLEERMKDIEKLRTELKNSEESSFPKSDMMNTDEELHATNLIASVEFENTKLRAQLEEIQNKNSALLTQLEEMKYQITEKTDELECLHVRVESQEPSTNDHSQQIELLELQNNLKAMDEANKELTIKLEALTTSHEAQIKEFKDQIENKQSRVETAEDRLRNAEQENNRLKEEVEHSLTELKKHEAELIKANERAEHRQNEIAQQMEAKLQEKMTELSELAEQKEQLRKQCKEQEENIEQYNGKIIELKNSMDKLKNELINEKAIFEQKLAEQSEKLSAKTETLIAEKNKLAQENSDFKKQVDQLNEELKKTRDEDILKLTELQKNVEEMTSQKKSIETQLEQITADKMKELTAKEEIIRSIEAEKSELREIMETERTQRMELEKKFQMQRNIFDEEKGQLLLELKTAKHELKRAQRTETQLKEKSSEVERLNVELQSLERNRDGVLERIKTMEDKLNETELIHKKEIEKARKDWEKASQKATANLQSEIRQLYHNINEKDSELAATHANILKLEDDLKSVRAEQEKNGMERRRSREQYNSFSDGVDLDELLDLKQRLHESEEEVQKLKSIVQQNENGTKPRSPSKREFRSQLSSVSDHLNFAEPTEAEYLRNVLYRYMTERETLGRESVTLAKVIATVCKFPPEQLNLVLRREEGRCQSWLPGTMHVLTHPALLQQNAHPALSPTSSSFNHSQQQQRLMSRQAPF